MQKLLKITLSSASLPGRGESWYGLKLPSGMVPLESQEGEKLLSTCTIKANNVNFFCKQKNRTFCGPCSLAISINALGLSDFVSKLSSEKSHTSDSTKKNNLLEDDIAYSPLLDAACYDIVNKGLTISQLDNIARTLGLRTSVYQVTKGADMPSNGNNLIQSADLFRDKVISFLRDAKASIIVNYYMESLGYINLRGHFSPLGAYHAEQDMFLVLDVWPDTPPAWVRSLDLYNAAATLDPDSKSWRGLLVINSWNT